MPKDFFSKLKTTIADTTKDVTQKTKDVVGISKLKSQISSEETRIEEAFLAIGKKFFEQNAGEVSDAFVEYFDTINDAKAKIAQYNTEICIIKGTYNCPSCGAEVQISAAFCAGCGAKLEPPVAKKEEDVVVEDAPVEDTQDRETPVESVDNN